jgi:SulP family sulfate permease
MAGILHAATILIVMQVAAPLAGHMAMPALAGLLIYTAWSMMEPQNWPALARAPLFDRVLILLTLALTVLVDLTAAIGTGVLLGVAHRAFVRRSQKAREDA